MKRVLLLMLLVTVPRLEGATYTVCASGCDYTTIAAAMGAVGASDTIQLNENHTESVQINSNFAKLTSDTGSRTLTTSSSNDPTLDFRSGLTAPLTIQGISLRQNSSKSPAVIITSRAANSKIYFIQCELYQQNNSEACMRDDSTFNGTDNLVFQMCLIHGGDYCFHLRGASTASVNCCRVENCILRNGSRGVVAYIADTSGTQIIVSNSTLGAYARAFDVAVAVEVRNCAFSGNTDDIHIVGGGAALTQFSYCGVQTENTANLGAACITISSANEFVNAGGYDYHLRSTAKCIDAGVSITGITTDYDGNTRPKNYGFDIGAFEYQEEINTYTETFTASPTKTASPTSTPTFTISSTNTWTPSFTVTPTPTPTHSPTDTPTWTATATPTDTPTATPTWTATATETATPSYTDTPTSTDTQTDTPTLTDTPTWTGTDTETATPTYTDTPTWTPTCTDTPTGTSTDTETDTPTYTDTPTWTHTVTDTPTWTDTDTPTWTPTASPTCTDTPTSTDTETGTPTSTATPTDTDTPTDTETATPTDTLTPMIFTWTDTPTYTDTPTSSPTDTPTSTDTETDTPTWTATYTPTASPTSTWTPTATETVTPTATPTQTPFFQGGRLWKYL